MKPKALVRGLVLSLCAIAILLLTMPLIVSISYLPPAIVLSLQAVAILFLLSVVPVLLLRWIRPPFSAFMIRTRAALRRSQTADTLGDTEIVYDWVDFESIAPEMQLAAIVAEDVEFPFHAGFDFKSIQAAAAYNRSDNRISDKKRGASTISQQVAKNLFLWPAQSYLRKAVEVYLTLLIEAFWSKRRILEVYLNIAQFGSHIFGVQAAARYFFGKSALELSTKESALLVSVLPNPVRHRVETPSHQVRSRQVMVLAQMNVLRDDFTCLMRESGLG